MMQLYCDVPILCTVSLLWFRCFRALMDLMVPNNHN